MAIPGIGLQSPQQLARPLADQQGSAKSANKNRTSSELAAEQASSTNLTDKKQSSNTELLAPVKPSIDSTRTETSRKNLVEIETSRKRFKLQKELGMKGAQGKAVQSFLEIADFERKDELSNLVGIDIFI